MKSFFLSLALVAVTLSYAQTLTSDFITVLKHDRVERLKILLDKADMEGCFETDNTSYGLLALSIKADAKTCFNYLLSQKANVEKTCSSKTPLMYAVKYGNLNMAKALIKAGANPNAKNAEGRTALTYAKKYKQEELTAFLKSL
jgi:ankyrin repeat protein